MNEQHKEQGEEKNARILRNTGFIAAYLVRSLLEQGHAVRVTVRDPENVDKVGYLWELNGAKERLKLVKADLMELGSFDEAVHGVDGVFHTASPVLVPQDNNIQATLIDPCIKGTMNVLESCKKASSVKRLVLTSSCSAIRYRDDVQQVSPLNESHWTGTEYCKRHNMWYAYAKTIAEKDASKIAGESGIDLVVVNPSFVVGPLLAPEPTSTLKWILGIVKGLVEIPNITVGFVHIDDVVAAHILAMEESKASGRLICSSSVAHWSAIIQMLKSKYPSYPYENKHVKKNSTGYPLVIKIPRAIKDFRCVARFVGVAVKLEITNHTGWIAAKLSSWVSLH